MLFPKPNRTKALLAILSIGGTLNASVPALCENKAAAKNILFNQIMTDATSTPDSRAYYLLRLANGYLESADETTVERLYERMGKNQSRGWQSTKDQSLVWWLETVATGVSIKTTSSRNLALATISIKQALKELEHSSDKSLKLNLYFAASRLLKAMGNESEFQKCQLVLTNAYKACDGAGPPDVEQVKGASSVLNLMAYGLIPFDLPDTGPHTRQPPALSSLTEEKFLNAEQLRLRALAFTDRLSPANHVRRKAHRDMVLWYADLQKLDKSEKQKQILFKLVGIKDNSILHPQYETCSTQPIWWEAPKKVGNGMRFCGMG